jgi:FRG domain
MPKRQRRATVSVGNASVQFETWDAFKQGYRARLPRGSDYDVYKNIIFRGQAQADWHLISTFDRNYGFKRAGSRDTLSKQLIEEFYEECARYSDWRYARDDPRVLAMAQHHGLPTRLLDWTFSPYVAAYFAFVWFLFEKPKAGGQVAIWALDRKAVQRRAPEGQLQIISLQDHENNRLGNQAGLFTFLKTNDANLEEYLSNPAVGLGSALVKFELPTHECRASLQDLLLMGIHHGTIFPGREGIAQTIKLRNLLRQEDN